MKWDDPIQTNTELTNAKFLTGTTAKPKNDLILRQKIKMSITRNSKLPKSDCFYESSNFSGHLGNMHRTWAAQWRGSSRIFRVAPTRSASVVLTAIPIPTLPQLIQAHKKAVGLKDFIQSLFFIHFAFVFQSKRDLITGLKTRTIAGRPNWDKVFKKVSENKKGRVTVFFCGPPQLGKLLKLKCDEFGFDYRKENF